MKYFLSALILLMAIIGCTKTEQNPYINPDSGRKGKLERHEGPIEILTWGPSYTKAGAGFNVQKNGESALWLIVRKATKNMIVLWNEEKMDSNSDTTTNAVTAFIPARLYSEQNESKLYILDTLTGRKSEKVIFVVY